MRWPVLLLLCALASGCSIDDIVANKMASSFDKFQAAFNRGESPKDAREGAPGLLLTLDGIIELSPQNERLLQKGAEMNATFAFGFIEEEDKPRARILYRKAHGYALRALAEEDEEWRKAVDGPEAELKARLAKLEAGDDVVPALFWTAFTWGSEINVSRTDSRAMADLPKVVLMHERLAEIAPSFYHAGPHFFLAVYYGSRGSTLGGDPKKSAAHFDTVRRLTGGKYAIADILYARFTCVALGEKEPARARKEFEAALARVRDMPLDADPEQRLVTALAKERAARLLPQLDDLILPPLPD